jgi:hypothetical protein
MIDFLIDLKSNYTIGAVGGSDFNKIKEQLGESKKII